MRPSALLDRPTRGRLRSGPRPRPPSGQPTASGRDSDHVPQDIPSPNVCPRSIPDPAQPAVWSRSSPRVLLAHPFGPPGVMGWAAKGPVGAGERLSSGRLSPQRLGVDGTRICGRTRDTEPQTAPATGSTRTGRRDPPRTARAQAQHRRRPAELAAVRAIGRSTIGVDLVGTKHRVRTVRSRLGGLVVGRRGATLGADRSRLCRRGVRPLRGAAASGMPGWPRLRRTELTADATIAPARRDEQPGHRRSVRGWRYENRRSCQQSCCRHASCVRRRHGGRLCA